MHRRYILYYIILYYIILYYIILYYIILYTLCHIAQASELSARVLCVLQNMIYFIHVVFILLLLPHGSKQGTVPYMQSPPMGNKMPVTCYIFIVF